MQKAGTYPKLVTLFVRDNFFFIMSDVLLCLFYLEKRGGTSSALVSSVTVLCHANTVELSLFNNMTKLSSDMFKEYKLRCSITVYIEKMKNDFQGLIFNYVYV